MKPNVDKKHKHKSFTYYYYVKVKHTPKDLELVGLVTPPLIASFVHSIKSHRCHKTKPNIAPSWPLWQFIECTKRGDMWWCHQTDWVKRF